MKKRKIVFITTFSLLLLLLVSLIPGVKVLSISNRKNTSERLYKTANNLKGFCILYTHSVNKGRVKDYYIITKDDKLCLDRTVFVSYGAGIPEPEETPGAIFTVSENGYEISNLNRIVPRLTMAVGIVANHGICFIYNQESTEQYLTDSFAPQTSIILEIKRVSLIEYIFNKLKPIKTTV